MNRFAAKMWGTEKWGQVEERFQFSGRGKVGTSSAKPRHFAAPYL